MKSCFISFAIILATLLAACSGGGKAAGSQFGFMDSVGISIDKDLLLGDTLTLPDIYCSDPSQRDASIQGKRINHDQYLALIVPAGDVFHDEMGNWRLLGVRDMGDGITLAAYYDGSGLGYMTARDTRSTPSMRASCTCCGAATPPISRTTAFSRSTVS